MKTIDGQIYFESDEEVTVIIGDKIVRGRLSDAEWEYNGLCEMVTIRFVKNRSDAAPTVEPQRMRGKGRWNVYYHGEENGKSIFSYSCNQCGYGAPYNFIGGVCEQKKWNFCPNCGADMREGQDEVN